MAEPSTEAVEALAKVLVTASKPLGASPFGGYQAAWRQAERILANPGPLLEALAQAGIGDLRQEFIPVPVSIDPVPDYSCRPCAAGEHERCQRRVVFVDWSHDCECAKKVQHRVAAKVLVAVLDQDEADA